MSVSTDVTRALLADGVMVTVRELGPADHDQVVALHRAMPEEDRYLRFFSAGLPPMDTFVNRITSPDQDDHGAIGVYEGDTLLGMAVYVVIRNSKPVTADVALVVSHDVQHHGVGTVLVEHLGSLARRPRTGRPLPRRRRRPRTRRRRDASLAEVLPEVAELDINPLVVADGNGIVVDARVHMTPTDYVDPYLRRMR